MLQLDRGRLSLLSAERIAEVLPQTEIPCQPYMAAYAVDCHNLTTARTRLHGNGIDFIDHDNKTLTVPRLPTLGGAITFTQENAAPPWL